MARTFFQLLPDGLSFRPSGLPSSILAPSRVDEEMWPLEAIRFLNVFRMGVENAHPEDEGWLNKLVFEMAYVLTIRERIKAARSFV